MVPAQLNTLHVTDADALLPITAVRPDLALNVDGVLYVIQIVNIDCAEIEIHPFAFRAFVLLVHRPHKAMQFCPSRRVCIH